MSPLIKLLRPHQYIKNGFVLIGPLFSRQWDLAIITEAFLAFSAFCLIASAVYILNDILDLEEDRRHPVKSLRPLPAGSVSVRSAWYLLTVVLASSLILAALSSRAVVFFVSIYFAINVLYSLKLKKIVILDVFIISSGFMLRILAGTIGLGIAPSQWLLLCGLMVTLFLGFAKRRAELLLVQNETENGSTRHVLDQYSPVMLDQFISITAACTVLSYGLYTVAPETVLIHQSTQLIYTLPFVVYGIFRYLFLLHQRSRGNDTASDLLTDLHMLITVGAWTVSVLWILK